jgi:hypothetical protein
MRCSKSPYSIISSARASRVAGLDAERARRLQVDDELELGRLQDRQVSGLLALEDAADVPGDSNQLCCYRSS